MVSIDSSGMSERAACSRAGSSAGDTSPRYNWSLKKPTAINMWQIGMKLVAVLTATRLL